MWQIGDDLSYPLLMNEYKRLTKKTIISLVCVQDWSAGRAVIEWLCITYCSERKNYEM